MMMPRRSCSISPSGMPVCVGGEGRNGQLLWASLPSSSASISRAAHYVATAAEVRNAVARHRRAPETANGVIIGRRAMARTFGCSVRTIDRWIANEGFPAATLPGGHLCMSSTLVDFWLLGRLKRDQANRPGTFPPLTDQPCNATSSEPGHPLSHAPTRAGLRPYT